MPLIKCPDCKTEVSDSAPACVKCGKPFAAAQVARSGSLIASDALKGFLIATAIGFFGAHTGCDNRTFEGGRYFMANAVVALFVGLVGGLVGGAVGKLRS
jgi:hypothetical protein